VRRDFNLEMLRLCVAWGALVSEALVCVRSTLNLQGQVGAKHAALTASTFHIGLSIPEVFLHIRSGWSMCLLGAMTLPLHMEHDNTFSSIFWMMHTVRPLKGCERNW
jgi:hypothetical protein